MNVLRYEKEPIRPDHMD